VHDLGGPRLGRGPRGRLAFALGGTHRLSFGCRWRRKEKRAEAESSRWRMLLREELETVTAPCSGARALCPLKEQLPGHGGTPHDARPRSCATATRLSAAWHGPAGHFGPTTLRLRPWAHSRPSRARGLLSAQWRLGYEEPTLPRPRTRANQTKRLRTKPPLGETLERQILLRA
jgi:hypothetical protein